MTPDRAIRLMAAAVVVAQSTRMATVAAASSDFFGDDIWLFHQSRTSSLLRYLTATIDVHPVPLHRALDLVASRLFSMHFGAAVALLLCLHWLSVYLLYRALEAMRSTPINAMLASWYGTYVYVGTLFDWWTAGVHRIPMVLLFLLGVLSFVRHRSTRTKASAVVTVACFIGALGFYEKAALFPALLIGVELALWPRTPPASRAAHAGLLAGLVALAGVYYVVWRAAVGPAWSQLFTDVQTLLLFTAVGWKVLASSLSGAAMELSWLGVAMGVLLVAVTTWRSRWNGVVWLVGAAVVSLSLASTGLSRERTVRMGLAIAAFAFRYYPDVMAVAVLFAGIAVHFALERRDPRGRGKSIALPALSGWGSVVLTLAAMSLVAVRALKSYEGLATFRTPVHAYMRELRTGLEGARSTGIPLRLLDGRVPPALSGLGRSYSRHSVLLTALGVRVVVVTKPGPGVYRIGPTGTLEPTGGER